MPGSAKPGQGPLPGQAIWLLAKLTDPAIWLMAPGSYTQVGVMVTFSYVKVWTSKIWKKDLEGARTVENLIQHSSISTLDVSIRTDLSGSKVDLFYCGC